MTDKAQFGGSTDYVASQDLMRAVNIAIALETVSYTHLRAH